MYYFKRDKALKEAIVEHTTKINVDNFRKRKKILERKAPEF